MIEFLTVDSEGFVRIDPKQCTSISRDKRAGVAGSVNKFYRTADVVTLHMAGGQKWRVATADFNRHASEFNTILFL